MSLRSSVTSTLLEWPVRWAIHIKSRRSVQCSSARVASVAVAEPLRGQRHVAVVRGVPDGLPAAAATSDVPDAAAAADAVLLVPVAAVDARALLQPADSCTLVHYTFSTELAVVDEFIDELLREDSERMCRDCAQAMSASVFGNVGGPSGAPYGYGGGAGPGQNQNGLGGGADEEDVAFSKLSVRDRLRTFAAPPSASTCCPSRAAVVQCATRVACSVD